MAELVALVSPSRNFPLNSGRLTARVVRRIAEELELNISAWLEDTRQIVGGKIEDRTKTANERVDLAETENGVVMTRE